MPRVFGIVVAAAGLAPAAIGILHHANPLRRLLNLRLKMIDADRLKPAQHQERAVDDSSRPSGQTSFRPVPAR